MIFHTRWNKPPDNLQIILNDTELERVYNSKFLGVIIQEDLSWNTHINSVCDRVSRATAILAKLKHYLPKYVLTLIYNSLCLSHIMYALPVWGSAPESSIGRLRKLHKKGIRHVCNSKYNSHTEPLFKKERILQLDDLYKLQCSKIMHKKIHNKLHAYHASKLVSNFEISNRNTRNKDDINIVSHNNNLFRMNSINYRIGTCWNELDLEVRKYSTKSAKTFTQHVKKWYLSRYSYVCNINDCYICNR